jgi:phosphopantetheine--protein transferase-like protein
MAVLAHEREVVEIAAVESMLAAGGGAAFSAEERRYAASKSDEARRLAARWAAKLAASRALGGGVRPEEVEVVRAHGAPSLRLAPAAEARRVQIGSPRVHVTLTHGLTHAAASVVLET